MANYCIVGTQKIHSKASMESRFNHDMRKFGVHNADISLSERNESLIETHGLSFGQLYDREVKRMREEGVFTRAERKGGVKAIEVVLEYSKEAEGSFSFEEWKEANLKWLDTFFNPPEHTATHVEKDGTKVTARTNNVQAAIVHNDETARHIHAFVIPFDAKGNLNASFYLNGREKCKELQDSYAHAMERFGLKRGTRDMSHITGYKTQREYYENLNKVMLTTLPEPRDGESIEEYRIRAEKEYQAERSQHNNDNVKNKQTLKEVMSVNRQVAKIFGKKALDDGLVRTIDDLYKRSQQFEKGVAHYPDREKAEEAVILYDTMVEFERKRERRRKERELDTVSRRLDE